MWILINLVALVLNSWSAGWCFAQKDRVGVYLNLFCITFNFGVVVLELIK